MVLGRAAFVFPLSFVHNWWAKEQLSVKEMVVIWCETLANRHIGAYFCA